MWIVIIEAGLRRIAGAGNVFSRSWHGTFATQEAAIAWVSRNVNASPSGYQIVQLTPPR